MKHITRSEFIRKSIGSFIFATGTIAAMSAIYLLRNEKDCEEIDIDKFMKRRINESTPDLLKKVNFALKNAKEVK